MRPNTSVRPPIIAGVRRRPLAELLRAWHSQPRKRSPGLFWGLVALACVLNTDILALSVHLLGGVDFATMSPPSERRMHVPFAGKAALWEPLCHWVIRVEGRPQLFESFCRDSVRAITGEERFEDNDPLAVVVSWMLQDNPGWDDCPFLRCDGAELRALLVREERGTNRPGRAERYGSYSEPSVLRRSKGFRQVLRGIAARIESGHATPMSPLERQALEVKERLTRYERIRSAGVDGGASGELETARAALSEAYRSGADDLFAAALSDFLAASRRALPVDDDAAVVRRLAWEGWLNEHDPFRQARNFGMFAAALLVVAATAGERRPLARRGFLLSGLASCAGCLIWAAAGFFCRANLHDGPPIRDAQEVVLWAASMVMGLGLVLALLGRDGFIALAGALASSAGFALADCWPAAFTANGPVLPNIRLGDPWMSLHLLTVVSAYAALALGWSAAILTLARLVLSPPGSERLSRLATPCARSLGIGVALMAAGAILGAVRADEPGYFWRGWNAQAMGTLLALPCGVALLYARRAGWIQPFGLLLGVVICFTTIVTLWHAADFLGEWDRRSAAALDGDVWMCWAVLVNLSLAVHAALRYYFGKQRVLV